MKIDQTVCDVCKKTKGEANKWLAALAVLKWNNKKECTIVGLVIGTISSELYQGMATKEYKLLDLCSDTCFQKVLNGVLELSRKVSEDETT